MVRASVVVPFRNEAEYIGRAVAALTTQEPPDGDYEVVLVDNGSTDGSADVVPRDGRVRVLEEPSRGAYTARNRGVSVASGAILAFTDADCAPRRTWLRALTAPFADDSVAVVVGCRVPAAGSRSLQLVAEYERAKDEFIFASGIHDLYYGSANNMAVRRDVLERHGPFLERQRGADALFVRSVVGAMSPAAVRYEATAVVEHLEIETIAAYYGKLWAYGRSFRRFGPLGPVRPLGTRERIRVWRAVAERHSSTDATRLLALLVVGAGFWTAGSWSARPESA